MAKKVKSSFRGKTIANAEKRKKGNSFSYLKLPNGVESFSPEMNSKVIMDFMPYLVTDKNHPDRDDEAGIATKGTYWYKRPFKIHRNIGARNEQVVCPTTFGKKCPICEYQQKLRKEDGDEDEIKGMRASERNLYAVMIKNDKKIDPAKIHVFDISDFLFQEVFEEQLVEEDPDNFEIFPDHREGVSVKVTFAEESFGGNKYAKPTRFDFVARKKQYTDDILDEIPHLDEILIVLSYEELKDKFFENVSDDDEDEEEETPKTRKSKKHIEPEEDEEEEEEDDYEEEEDDDKEEEEDEDDEEEDEDDEEEEEEEPAPPIKKTKKGLEKSVAKKSSKKQLGCPYGHTFGKDNDRFDDCDDCEVWNECKEAKSLLRKK